MSDTNVEIPAKDLLSVALKEETPVTTPATETPSDVVTDENKNNPGATTQQQSDPKPVSLADMSEEEIEKELERRGKKIVPVTAPPEPTAKEKQEAREKAKFKYAIDNNVVTLQKLEQYHIDKAKTAREIVFAQFVKDNSESGKTLDELEREFTILYFEEADDATHGSIKKRRQTEMEKDAERIMKRNYPEIYSLDKKYDDYESEQANSARLQQEVKQKTEAYTSNVNSIVSSIKNIDIQVRIDDNTTETVPFEVPNDVLTAVQEEFLSEKRAKQLSDATPEQIREAIDVLILKLTHSKQVSWAAKQWGSKLMEQQKIGRRHMNADEVPVGDVTIDRDEQAYSLLGPQFAPQTETR